MKQHRPWLSFARFGRVAAKRRWLAAAVGPRINQASTPSYIHTTPNLKAL